MSDNDKWVWEDQDDASPLGIPLLDAKLTPIVEWESPTPDLPSGELPEKESPDQPRVEAAEPAPAPVEAPPAVAAQPLTTPVPVVSATPPASDGGIPPSVMRAIVFHLEGRLEEAVAEIRVGLQAGEPPAALHSAMGALLLELERFEEAADSYREVLQSDPKNVTAGQHLATCLEKLDEARKAQAPSPSVVKAIAFYREGKVEEAVKELQRGMKGSGEPPLDVCAALGHLQFELGRFDNAADAYREALRRDPLHKTCHYNLAVCLEKIGRHKEAQASFQKAREIEPGRLEIAIGLGVSLLHLKQFADAVTVFEASLAEHPLDGTALFGYAFALQCAGRPADAEAVYLRALDRDPSQREILLNLIAVSVEQGKDAATRSYAEKLLAVDPDSRVALESLMAVDLAEGRHEEAYTRGDKLTRLAPDSFEAWFNFGLACQGVRKQEHVVAAFAKAARIRPKSFEALSSLGQAMQERGDIPGAKSAYESALKLSPNHPGVLWSLILIAEKSGSAAEAERLCELLAAKAPKPEAALFRLGSLRYERGDYAGSVEAFRNCLKERSDWPAAHLNLGMALWRAGQRAEARQTIESLSAPPYSTDGFHFLAMMAAEREDYQNALGYYKKLADAGERSPELFYNTGLILQNLGRADEAAKQYREAIAVKPDLDEAVQALAQVSKAPEPTEESKKNGRPKQAPQLLKAR